MHSKKTLLFICMLITACFSIASTSYGASTTPATVNAAYGQSTTVALHYTFPVVAGAGATITSPYGQFCLTGSLMACDSIGRVNMPLTTTTALASEVLTIPQAVVERALQRGFNSFTYERNFLNGGFYSLKINITPGSVAAFSLRRIELYFDHMQRKNEVMVQRNYRGLKAYADIYYNGSGMLNGYWEVDGLVIERVNRFVPTGGKVTLATPAVPDLPTFDPGYHIVKFIVVAPETSFEVPEMVYWVKGTDEPAKRTLVLNAPQDGVDIPADSSFAWEKMEKAAVYLISFAKAEDKTICFSALTRDTAYRIPASILAEYFSAGRKFLWSVKGYDTENNIIAESGMRSFSFREAAQP